MHPAKDPVALLRALVEGRDLAAVVHEDVTLLRGDGSLYVGRSAVAELFAGSDPHTYEVVAVEASALRVALRAEGAPGALVLRLHGEARDGRLGAVRVEVLGFL